MDDATKTTNTTPDTKTEVTAPGSPPELTINTAADISAQVDKLRLVEIKGNGRSFTSDGFKHLGGLDGMGTPELTVMAGAIVRQIVANGDSKKPLEALRAYSTQVGKEIEQEKKLDAYILVGKEHKVSREAGESISDFIGRVEAAVVASAKK